MLKSVKESGITEDNEWKGLFTWSSVAKPEMKENNFQTFKTLFVYKLKLYFRQIERNNCIQYAIYKVNYENFGIRYDGCNVHPLRSQTNFVKKNILKGFFWKIYVFILIFRCRFLKCFNRIKKYWYIILMNFQCENIPITYESIFQKGLNRNLNYYFGVQNSRGLFFGLVLLLSTL